MPLTILRHDITKFPADAIVNAANPSLLGGGGVDGAIHRAAGPELLDACRRLGGCAVGEAKATRGYRLPCKYVIHTVGPVWQGGGFHEAELLASCYRNSLHLALEKRCASVAFPLISSGVYGYPKAEALRIATETIASFLLEHEMQVYLVIFDKAAFQIGEAVFSDLRSFIDDRYVDAHTDVRSESLRAAQIHAAKLEMQQTLASQPEPLFSAAPTAAAPYRSLEDAVQHLDESFSEMLLRKIDERGITDAMCYKKANVDRKLFSKIRGNRSYRPSKQTALAFAVALELDIDETRELLEKAGFALSHSNRFDIILEYFISRGNYNIFEINEALFAFDQMLLGA